MAEDETKFDSIHEAAAAMTHAITFARSGTIMSPLETAALDEFNRALVALSGATLVLAQLGWRAHGLRFDLAVTFGEATPGYVVKYDRIEKRINESGGSE